MNLFRREGRRKRLPVVAFAGVLFAFQAIGLVGANVAQAAFTNGSCSFTGGVLTVALGVGGAVDISADSSDNITLDSGGGAEDTALAGCTAVPAGKATLTNTTEIDVNGDTGDEEVLIDLSVDWGLINWKIDLKAGTGDFISLYNATDVVAGTLGIDLDNDGDLDVILIAGVEELDVDGTIDADSIFGGGGGVTGGPTTIPMFVVADIGDDTVSGGAGNDDLNGEGGNDTVDYSGFTGPVTVDLSIAAAQNTVGAGTDTLAGFENLAGSAGSDTLTGDGADNVITGNAGDDTIDCAGNVAVDLPAGLYGDTADFSDSATTGVVVDLDAGTATGDGTDTLKNCESVQGSELDDTIAGDDGDNALFGGGGNDSLSGGGGGGDGIDILDGEAGSDWVDYSLETDPVTVDLTTVAGTPANGLCGNVADFDDGVSGEDCVNHVENAVLTANDDTFVGNAFSNTVEPNGGQNSLTGGAGSDTLDYSVGYDAGVTVNLAGGAASDDAINGFENVIGTAFADNITGDDFSNTIKSRKGSDNVRAGAGDDTVKAGAGNDLVRGGTGDDDLWGQKGNDNLNGGKGSDFCKGGPGKDKLKSCESGHK